MVYEKVLGVCQKLQRIYPLGFEPKFLEYGTNAVDCLNPLIYDTCNLFDFFNSVQNLGMNLQNWRKLKLQMFKNEIFQNKWKIEKRNSAAGFEARIM